MRHIWISLAFGLAALPACAPAATPGLSVAIADAPDGHFSAVQYADGHGCAGHNTSPAVAWAGAPAEAKSFAITIFDRDANNGKGFWHWLAAGIPAKAGGLQSGASGSPAMTAMGVAEAVNDFGGKGYGGPCPPSGQNHHYVITVYALDVVALDMKPGTTPAEAAATIKSHAIAKGETTLEAAR